MPQLPQAQAQPQAHHISASALSDRSRSVVNRLLDITFPTAADYTTIQHYWKSLSAEQRSSLVATPFSPIRTSLKDAIKQRCSCNNCKWSHISFLSRSADLALESRFHELRDEQCRCSACVTDRPLTSPASASLSATHVNGECLQHLSLFSTVLALRDSRSLQTQHPPIAMPKSMPPGGVVSVLPHAAESACLARRLAELASRLPQIKIRANECDACAAWLGLELYWAKIASQQVCVDASLSITIKPRYQSCYSFPPSPLPFCFFLSCYSFSLSLSLCLSIPICFSSSLLSCLLSCR
jgi:hypothetical protein